MGNFISFGKINKQYKYILIHIIISLLIDYMFSEIFPKQIRPSIFQSSNYPPNILVSYLGSFIFSFFLYFYEKFVTKEKKKDESRISDFNLKRYKFIHYISKPGIKLRTIIITSILAIISFEFSKIFDNLGFMSLNYFSFFLFFFAYVNLIMFGIPIFSHKKCAVIVIVIFSTIFNFISNYEYLSNNKYNLFYKNHIALIPIFVIVYILSELLKAYSFFKIKWIFDYKFIPVSIFFIIYNFLGIIIFLIPCLISSYIKCVDKTTLNDVDLICLVKIEKGKNIEFYFDSFSYYFEQLWRNDRNINENILYLILFII